MAKLSYPATKAYKQWVWTRLRELGWVLQDLVDAMKRADRSLTTITTSTLIQLLGAEDDIAGPSNSITLPAINKALGIAPPPVCDPADELSQIRDRFIARWNELTPREKAVMLQLLGDESEAKSG
jgi:hypothetical protein